MERRTSPISLSLGDWFRNAIGSDGNTDDEGWSEAEGVGSFTFSPVLLPQLLVVGESLKPSLLSDSDASLGLVLARFAAVVGIDFASSLARFSLRFDCLVS